MKALFAIPFLFLTSCESLKPFATWENFDRALIIYDAAKEIKESRENPVIIEK